MGLTFRKEVKLLKNIKVNLSGSGVSISFKIPKIGSINLKDGKINITASRNGIRFRKTLKKD